MEIKSVSLRERQAKLLEDLAEDGDQGQSEIIRIALDSYLDTEKRGFLERRRPIVRLFDLLERFQSKQVLEEMKKIEQKSEVGGEK